MLNQLDPLTLHTPCAHTTLRARTVVVTIDKWITLRMTEANAVLIKYLRKELEDVLTDRCVRAHQNLL